MLIYNPLFDAYHTLFRMLIVVDAVKELEIDKARILDFYLLYPSLVSEVRLPNDHKSIRKEARSLFNSYHDPINPRSIFTRMKDLHLSAIRCLAATGLIDNEQYSQGDIRRTTKKIPEELVNKINNYVSERDPVSSYILNDLSAISINGHNGLKGRSNLMEFKYDVT